MTNFVGTSLILVLVSVGLVLLVRRNLRQRELARKLRDIFVSAAEDLVGKADLPDAHARQLMMSAAIPGGWITRYMVYMLFRQIVFGTNASQGSNKLSITKVPPQLRAKYVTALLALVLSDSYRCAILGRIWRGANNWIFDAIKEVKPDVDAHATKFVVEQVTRVHAPRWLEAEHKLVTA